MNYLILITQFICVIFLEFYACLFFIAGVKILLADKNDYKHKQGSLWWIDYK